MSELINNVEYNLKKLGLVTSKVLERKRKIQEDEVTKKAMNEVHIGEVEAKIVELEG